MILPVTPVVGEDDLYEIINGEKVIKPVSTYENVLAGLLFARLHAYAESNGFGRAVIEVMFDLPNLPNDRRPDVGFVSFDRWPLGRGIPRTKAWAVVPDLAVEVVSPYDDFRDVVERVGEYFRAGVRSVWLVVPGEEVVYRYTSRTDVCILTRGEELTGEPVLPGFRVALADLFPPPDETPAGNGP
jgi:Uma2 family endonuclease